MYSLRARTWRPPSTRPKKSTFQASSGRAIARVIMLARSELSSHSAAAVTSTAMSENHRKFLGPQCYTGTSTPRDSGRRS
jgi:hypothetical protein